MSNDTKILLLIAASLSGSIAMYYVTSDPHALIHPFPFCDIDIHPQAYVHLGMWRVRSMLLISALYIALPRYWKMLTVFFFLEFIDLLDFGFRYGEDFYFKGLDMNTIKLIVYILFIGYNLIKNNRETPNYDAK